MRRKLPTRKMLIGELADNAAAKLIAGTKIVSAANPLSQIVEKHQ
jgi:hypothetical protein